MREEAQQQRDLINSLNAKVKDDKVLGIEDYKGLSMKNLFENFAVSGAKKALYELLQKDEVVKGLNENDVNRLNELNKGYADYKNLIAITGIPSEDGRTAVSFFGKS